MIFLLFILSVSLVNSSGNPELSKYGVKQEYSLHSVSFDSELLKTLDPHQPQALLEMKMSLEKPQMGEHIFENLTDTVNLHFILEQLVVDSSLQNQSWIPVADSSTLETRIDSGENLELIHFWDIYAIRNFHKTHDEPEIPKTYSSDEESQLRIRVITNSKAPIGIVWRFFQLGEAARYEQLIAGVLLVCIYSIIVFDFVHRTLAALLGAFATLVTLALLRTLPSPEVVMGWVDVNTLGLLMGMMIVVGVMASSGAFEYAAVLTYKYSGDSSWKLTIAICLITAFLSAFLDNVTTVLLLTPPLLRITKVAGVPPIPLLLSMTMFSNIGGTATLIGDAPNLILASIVPNLTFSDFILNLGPPVVLSTPICLWFCSYKVTKSQIRISLSDVDSDEDDTEKSPRNSLVDEQTNLLGNQNGRSDSSTPSNYQSLLVEQGVVDEDTIDTDTIENPPTLSTTSIISNLNYDTVDVSNPQEDNAISHLRSRPLPRPPSRPSPRTLSRPLFTDSTPFVSPRNLLSPRHEKNVFSSPLSLAPVVLTRFAETDSECISISQLEKDYKIHDLVLFKKCCFCLFVIIVFFLLEPVTHIVPVWVAMAGASLLLLFCSPHELDEFIHKVEWTALLFFAGLFIMIEGMSEMGLIRFLGGVTADLIFQFPDDIRLASALSLILWISAIASMFIDNIPFTSTMVYIILQLAEDVTLNLPLRPMVWSLALGACLGGNGSIVGASANIVVASIAEQSGHKISFLEFFKMGFPIMIISVLVSNFYILFVYVYLGWQN